MGTPGKVESLGENGSPFRFATSARRARRRDSVFGGDPVRLIAPVGSDPGGAQWVEVPTGLPVADDEVRVATYGEELVRLVLHPESKMLGPDGKVCRYTTRGLLRPRPVLGAAVHVVGKEGNRIDEVATGEVTDPEEALNYYGDDAWEHLVLPVSRLMGIRRLARETGLDRSQFINVILRRSSARLATRTLVIRTVAAWAANEIGIDKTVSEPNVIIVSYLSASCGHQPAGNIAVTAGASVAYPRGSRCI